MESEFGQSLGKVGDLKANEEKVGKQLNLSVRKRRDWLGGLDSNQDRQIQSPAADQKEAYASALETWLKRIS